MDDAAVSIAIKRFETKAANRKALQAQMKQMTEMLDVDSVGNPGSPQVRPPETLANIGTITLGRRGCAEPKGYFNGIEY